MQSSDNKVLGDETLVFEAVPSPTQDDIESIVHKARKRILRYLEKRRVIPFAAAPGEGEVNAIVGDGIGESDPTLTGLLSAATRGEGPTGFILLKVNYLAVAHAMFHLSSLHGAATKRFTINPLKLLIAQLLCLACCLPLLLHANPVLVPGVWTNITPPIPNWGIACCGSGWTDCSGISLDPSNPSTLFATVPGDNSALGTGIWKSTDAGSTWTQSHQIIRPTGSVTVDPGNPNHLYASAGLNGAMGFWVSNDGGNTWTQPPGFVTVCSNPVVGTTDLYHVEADPADFNHILCSFHSTWKGFDSPTVYACGVIESKDGGNTWIIHNPDPAMTGPGFGVHFLYNPVLGIGNSSTWEITTQSSGWWKTTDAGATWVKATFNNNPSNPPGQHGYPQIYYSNTGVLYSGAAYNPFYSLDNGSSWKTISNLFTFGDYYGLAGDGNLIYTLSTNSGATFKAAPESSATTGAWTSLDPGHAFNQGSASICYDPIGGILYSANYGAGIWALKVIGAGNVSIDKGKGLSGDFHGPRVMLVVSGGRLDLQALGIPAYDLRGARLRQASATKPVLMVPATRP